jgi:hypothetical protein
MIKAARCGSIDQSAILKDGVEKMMADDGITNVIVVAASRNRGSNSAH